MSILHTVNSSPFQTLALQQCLAILGEQDSLLLIEDGVVACQAKHADFLALSELAKQGQLMVLEADLQARGISARIGKSCSYLQFVELVAGHKSQMAW
ncbi:sulfurtransferase complex subunit TusB [Psychromonas hadalis]|uniref:sulfurtransferase complex subunit TusB n=1 Tax=Psychromonas hadalis TaxID=211669 RepID=UPI0003B33A6D|nr:sulfurtransferase complex subunit TusB [Psychromonas hadalis]